MTHYIPMLEDELETLAWPHELEWRVDGTNYRVDCLVFHKNGLIAIEYQGYFHSFEGRAAHDEAKYDALRSKGIKVLEVTAGATDGHKRELVRRTIHKINEWPKWSMREVITL